MIGFFLCLYLSIVLGHIFGRIASTYIDESLRARTKTTVRILLPTQTGNVVIEGYQERGDGKATILKEPTAEEYEEFKKRDSNEWQIARALKNVLKGANVEKDE